MIISYNTFHIPIPGTPEWEQYLAWVEENLKNKKEISMEYWEGSSIEYKVIGGKKNREVSLNSFKMDNEKILGSISLTQEGYKKVLKTAKKKMEKELDKLREKNEEENIKSDFYMTHEIAKISGEIKGIIMIYDALEEAMK